MYFHVVYWGARRRYGGAGRNSPSGPTQYSIPALGCDIQHKAQDGISEGCEEGNGEMWKASPGAQYKW